MTTDKETRLERMRNRLEELKDNRNFAVNIGCGKTILDDYDRDIRYQEKCIKEAENED